MKLLLYIIGALAGSFAALYLLCAESAIHEIASFVVFCVSAVCIGCGAIVGAVNRLTEETERNTRTVSNVAQGIVKLRKVIEE